jgi:hypothetical protein
MQPWGELSLDHHFGYSVKKQLEILSAEESVITANPASSSLQAL